MTYTLLLGGWGGYVGDFAYQVSGPGQFSVPARAFTEVTVSAAPNPATVADLIDLSALVTSPAAGADLSGFVEFFADGDSLGTVAVISGSGSAVLPAIILPLGTHQITAVYSGNTSTRGSTSDQEPVTVTEAVSTTTLTALPNSITAGDDVVLSASVSGYDPSGDVDFLADGVSLGVVALVNGVATLPVSSLTAGTYAITATYAGDSFNLPSSTLEPVSLTVHAPALEVSADPEALLATAGEPYTFPVTVVDHTGAALSPQPTIAYTSPDCTVTGGNVFETAGVCTVEAAATVHGQTIGTSFQVTVEAGPAHALTLTPTASTVTQGGSVTFTLAGEDAYGNPVDTSEAVLTSSVATDEIDGHTVTPADTGSRQITATLNAVNSHATIEVIAGPINTLTLTPSVSTVEQGGSVTFTLSGEDAYGNPVDTSEAVLTSSVATDEIDGHTVTFPSASPHTITATLEEVTSHVTIEVIPVRSGSEDPAPALRRTGAEPQGVFWGAALGLLLAGAGAVWYGHYRRQPRNEQSRE